jgi:hypothetical protein
MLLSALAACTGTSISLPSDDTAGATASDAPVVDVGDAPGDTGDTDEGHTDGPDGCSDLYDPDVLQEFSIEISDAEWAELVNDYASGQKDYHAIVFHYGDEVVDDAMIRLKGNPGFSWYDDKMQFVIAFNEVDPAGRFHGQRKISLDASWYEPTMVRDRVSWAVMRGQGGLPFACANSATLTVNGDYYGVYTNIEFFDHEWLERSFGKADATGTLWKYGYDPVANEEASTGAAIARMSDTTDPDTLAGLGDLDEWELEWAAEAVLGDDDGYWCCNHNYYLYEHPTRGILFVPWDFDDNFDVQPYDADPVSGYYSGLFQQPQFLALVRDPVWGPRYVEQIAAMNAAMDPATVVDEIDTWEAQVADALQADPHRSIGWEEHVAAMDRLRAWVPARHAFVDSWVACQGGATTDADGDGHPVCDDPDDTDATIHPGATEICNGIDDDADGWVDDDAACDDCARHDLDDAHYLFCRWPRTNADAEANCASRGGTLVGPATTGQYYMYFFYAWPVTEVWWTAAGSGARCTGWDEANYSFTQVSCAEAHPSVCGVP